jgi:NAD+ synthase
MTRAINIGLAQINPTVGDITGNVQLIAAAAADGAAAGCELVVFPELCVSGYPPEDLVLRDNFLDQVAEGVAGLAKATAEGPALLVGAPWREDGATYNAALLLADGAVQSVVHKTELPNYGVFDEKRVFAAGGPVKPISFAGVQLGVLVCEDMWIQAPAQNLRDQGADMLVVINGSPFETDKTGERGYLARARVQETGLPLVYVNQVGGQDELVLPHLRRNSQPPGSQKPRAVSHPSRGRLCSRKEILAIFTGHSCWDSLITWPRTAFRAC